MDLFSNLKSFFKANTTTTDNSVFRLHYKATSVILVAFSILVTARQYIGDPIDCLPTDNIPEKMLDTFCWVTSTFSLPDAWKKKVGKDVPYPGVDKYVEDSGVPRVYHAYYQWVCFVLFLQALLFYIPRYFWRTVESGRIKSLIVGLNSPILNEETKTTNRKLLVEYMVANLGNHSFYFAGFVFAEVLNFVNVVGQMFLMNAFLGGEFSKYGINVIQFTGWDGALRFDPMIQVFPRVTKCLFYKFGSSGSVSKHDTMCVLPINIINEKIYIFLWFWFIILAVLTALVLVYRLVLMYFPVSRFKITSSRARIADRAQLKIIIGHCKMGDWFVLDLLSKNLDSLNFRDLVRDLSKKLEEKTLTEFYNP